MVEIRVFTDLKNLKCLYLNHNNWSEKEVGLLTIAAGTPTPKQQQHFTAQEGVIQGTSQVTGIIPQQQQHYCD